jgi:hypothetical protein
MSSEQDDKEDHKLLVGLVGKVKIIGRAGSKDVMAIFDTGATRTSIGEKLVNELGLEKLPKEVKIKTKTHPEDRVVRIVRRLCRAKVEVRGKVFEVEANIADRSNMAYPVLIGRDIIHGNFIVDVSLTHKSNRIEDLR